MMLELFDYDLNLLKTLSVLLQEKHTGRAAERLNTTQPVVSRSLAKIRDAIGDPLFIRHSRGFTLTHRAQILERELPEKLQQLENLLRDEAFSADQLRGTLRIATNVMLMEIYGHRIYELLSKHAPHLQIELHDFGEHTGEQILTGEIDFAISFPLSQKTKQLRQVEIARVNFGMVCRKSLTALPDVMSLKQAKDYPIAGLIVPSFNQSRAHIEQYSDFQLKLNFRSQHFGPLMQVVKNSDTLFVGLLEFEQVLDPTQFRVLRVSDKLPMKSSKVNFIYNNSQHYSSKHQWLLKLFQDEFSPVPTPTA